MIRIDLSKENKYRLERRLNKHKQIDETTNCWNWTGSDDGAYGYGKIKIQGRMVNVSRVTAALYHNLDINNSEQLACHHCDNPRCFNPTHLYVGSNASNNLDMRFRNRHINSKKTHCINGHRFSEDNTYIYTRKSNGNITRQCKACTIERDKKRNEPDTSNSIV